MTPTTWPQTVQFLCERQREIERIPVIGEGRPLNAQDLDDLCLEYLADIPKMLTANAKRGLLQRFEWARLLAATPMNSFRKADGSETGRLLCPHWEVQSLMRWFLIDTWRTVEKLYDAFPHPLPLRPKQPHNVGLEGPSLLGNEAN